MWDGTKTNVALKVNNFFLDNMQNDCHISNRCVYLKLIENGHCPSLGKPYTDSV